MFLKVGFTDLHCTQPHRRLLTKLFTNIKPKTCLQRNCPLKTLHLLLTACQQHQYWLPQVILFQLLQNYDQQFFRLREMQWSDSDSSLNCLYFSSLNYSSLNSTFLPNFSDFCPKRSTRLLPNSKKQQMLSLVFSNTIN